MDMSKLTTGDRVIGISAILLLIFSFLPWFEASVDFGGGDLGIDFSESASENGWGIGFLWAGVPVILGLAMLVYVLISRFSPDTDLPQVVAALLVVLKLIIGVDENDLLPGAAEIDDEFVDDFLDDLDLSVTRQIGIYLSALAAIGLAVGAFLRMREDQAASNTPPTAF